MFYQKTVLDNGVTVYTERMDGVRSVALGMWMRVGNRDEDPATYGMSHFMEHMLFKGTPTRSAADISMAFDALGAELNAFTSREYTCFYSRMIDERLADGFEILADMVVNASFAQEDIDPERKVVLEEIARAEDQPEDQVFDLLASALMPGHPLGRPVLGTNETVSSFMSADMKAYHAKHYTTGNLAVVACGSVDHEQLVALAERYLSEMRAGERLEREQRPCDARETLAAIEKQTEQAHLLVGLPGITMSDPRRYAFALLDMVLGGGMSSRLFQEIREKRGLVYAVYSMMHAYEDAGTFAVYAGTRPENVNTVVELIYEELHRIADEGVTPAELERVCELACGNFVLSMEATRNHMTRMGRFVTCGVELSNIDEVVANYRAVTIEQVNQAAQALMSSKPTLAVVSPYAEDKLAEQLAGTIQM